MRRWATVMDSVLLALLILCSIKSQEVLLAQTPVTGITARIFTARGLILEIKPDDSQIVIRHEAIAGYMAAMTMPFPVKNPDALAGLQRGDEVEFQLNVAETESWVDHFVKIG